MPSPAAARPRLCSRPSASSSRSWRVRRRSSRAASERALAMGSNIQNGMARSRNSIGGEWLQPVPCADAAGARPAQGDQAMTIPTRRAALVAGALGLALAAGSALAQSWPDKPLRIMVGASAGGGTDILARMLADKFAPDFKQSVVVENRPGASNTIAADIAAHATPDGATLLLATNTGQVIAPHLMKLKFDPLKDLQPVGLVAVMPNVLVVSAASPYKSVKELLAAMVEKPGQLKYASSG